MNIYNVGSRGREGGGVGESTYLYIHIYTVIFICIIFIEHAYLYMYLCTANFISTPQCGFCLELAGIYMLVCLKKTS